jgi:hypothetical protein
MAIYSDRHTIFRSPKQNETTLEQQLLGQFQPLSQIGRIISVENVNLRRNIGLQ